MLEVKTENPKLLIIGAGTAGMACAITAAENGAKVLVIEKTDKVGGTLHLTGGHLSAGGTNRQKSRGIEDSPFEHFQAVMRLSRQTANKELVKLATDEAPKTLDWLEENGFDYADESPRIIYGHPPYEKPRTHYGKESGVSIFKAMLPLWEKQVALGNITVLLKHKLIGLHTEGGRKCKPSPRVVGAMVENENGEQWFYRANSTVLATGGYAGNPEMFAQLHPNKPRLITGASINSTGEGIEIAVKIGGKIWNTEKLISGLGGVEIEPNTHRSDFWTHWAMVYTAVYRSPREIYVNAEGSRFMDENEPDADLRERYLEQQTDEKFWAIFDENSFNGEMQILPKFTPDQIRTEAKNGKFLWQADSIEDLAKRIGVDAETLNQTVSQFNESVANQNDKQFGRKYLENYINEPPFYALLTYGSSLVSCGGLAVNGDLQVVDKEDNPIPNLYAIGEILGSGATTGNAFCSGMLVTPALSFGRILGRRLNS